jgi:hypothetical protein
LRRFGGVIIAVACAGVIPTLALFVVISLDCWVVIPALAVFAVIACHCCISIAVLAATTLVKSVLGTFDNPTCVFVTL